MDMGNQALKGLRIADFSWVLAGPYTTMLLSFLGAEVIKFETHKHMDQVREGSISTGDDFEHFEASSLFNNLNLNKKSVSLDLKDPRGVELAKQIVAKSDVVVENMRSGVMDKLGLGYKDLIKVKPDLVMLSSSGFGAEGPYGNYAGYAPIFSAFGGLAYLSGYEDSFPDTMSGVLDLRVGTVATIALLAAMIRHQKTGEGQYIDLSSSECVSTLIGSELLEYSMNKRSPKRCGNQDSVMAPHNCYRCKGADKWISIAVATDTEWNALCKAMGNPAWSQNEAYSDQFGRWQNRRQLDEYISAWTADYTSYALMDMLQRTGVAAMPSFSAEEILSDPHVHARGKILEIEHPVMGLKKVISPPWKLSETPATIRKSAPLLGENNEEIFCGLLGLSAEEMHLLESETVIY